MKFARCALFWLCMSCSTWKSFVRSCGRNRFCFVIIVDFEPRVSLHNKQKRTEQLASVVLKLRDGEFGKRKKQIGT